MSERSTEREPRRDPGEPVPKQAPGARQDEIAAGSQIEGAAEDFTPRTVTDIAQHAPGPHGQGDEPSSAPAGRHDYDDDAGPEVRTTPSRDR